MKVLSIEIAQRWVNALRSGEYKQTKTQLQDEEGFCCLGVLCDLELGKKARRDAYGHISGSTLGDQGLNFDTLDGVNLTLDEQGWFLSLADLNDNGDVSIQHGMEESHEPFTFDEIADIIQAVVIEGVLK